jgi:PAS domain S-box-containing protein
VNDMAKKVMNLEPGDIGDIGKGVAGAAAIAGIAWKVVLPLWRWLLNWGRMGKRIEEIMVVIQRELEPNGSPMAHKVSEISAVVKVLMAKDKLSFESSLIPSYQCDQKGDCIAVNPAWCKLFGVTEHNMLGHGWLDVIFGAEERSRVLKNWMASVRDQYPHRENYVAINRSTGRTMRCESATVTYTDAHGNPLMYFGQIKLKDQNYGDKYEEAKTS